MTSTLGNKPSSTPRLAALDGVRGMAIFMVMLGHLMGALGALVTSYFLSRFIFASPLHLFFNEKDAVIIFFALSGFVLQLPYIKKERPLDMIGFWGMRFFRLYPAHLLCLAVCFFFHHFLYNPAAVIAFNEGLHIFFTPLPNWGNFLREAIPILPSLEISTLNGPLWSLFVEFKISLLFPLIIFLSRRLSFTGFLFLTLTLFIPFAFWSENTLKYLPIFTLGAFAAQYQNKFLPFIPEKKSQQILVFLVLLSLFQARYFMGVFLPNWLNAHHLFMEHAYNSLTALCSCALMLLVLKEGPVKKLFSLPPLVWAGRMTLPLYLLAFATFFVCLSVLTPFITERSMLFAVAAPLSLLITFVASYFIHIWLEMPLNQVGHKIFRKKVASKPAESAAL